MRKPTIKLAYIHFAFFYSGGGEKLVFKQVDWLRKKGYQVDLWTPLVDEKLCFPDLAPKMMIKEIFPGLSWIFRQVQLNSLIYAIAFLALLVMPRFAKYKLVIGDHHPSAWFCYLIHRLYGTPYILYLAQPTRLLYQRKIDREVGLQFKGPLRLSKVLGRVLKPLIFFLDRDCLLSAAAVIANGRYAKGSLEAIYGRKVINCPAGADFPKNKKARHCFGGELTVNSHKISKPFILLTNRHIPHKKIEWMIEAMKDFKKENVRLVITGQKTEFTNHLVAAAERFKVQDKVIFVGLVSEEELHRLYSHAAVYVYSSPQEDFGMGVIEAQAHRVPVVAWKAGGVQYTIKHGKTGFLVKPYSLKTFQERVKELLDNRTMNYQMGRNALDWARKFSWNSHNMALEKIIKQANRKAG